MKISVIIPIYNTEEYLSKCIESVIYQDYIDLEIILVDDGSTDNSLRICESYRKKDQRIVIITKNNSGVSDSRNQGLKAATGDYVAFLDSDDWIDSDMYSKMLASILKYDADLCFSGYVSDDVNKSIHYSIQENQKVFDSDYIKNRIIPRIMGSDTLLWPGNEISGSVCRILFKRKIINNKIYFDTNLHYGEDTLFTMEVLFNCCKVSVVDESLYHYVQRENSAVHSYRPDFKEEEENLSKKYIELLKIYSKDSNYVSQYKKNIDNRFLKSRSKIIANESSLNNKKKLKDKLRYIRDICNEERLIELLKEVKNEELPFKMKCKYKMMEYKMSLLLYLYYRYIIDV